MKKSFASWLAVLCLVAACGGSGGPGGSPVPFDQYCDEYAQMAHMLLVHPYMNAETIRMDGGIRMAPH